MVVADHFSPPATVERAVILRKVQDFCKEHAWPLRLFEGICHELLIDDPRTRPGTLIIGSDSHTVTAGALGCVAIGFGSTDVFGVVLKGRIALRVPPVVRVVLQGRLHAGVMGKDIMLDMFRRSGPEKLNDTALEFVDTTEGGIAQSDRFSICNMVTEAGGKAALFVPDAITEAFLRQRDGQPAALRAWGPDPDPVDEVILDVSAVEPLVALPHSPFNVAPLRGHEGTPLDQVFIGSCNAGRLSDLQIAARILEGRQVAPGLKTIVIPGTRQVYLDALDAGCIQTLVRAGAVVAWPSCGPCGAIDKGVLAPGERCAATINRNYQGRMGSPDAEIFLVSPATAAASMVTGTLTDPRKFL